MPIHLGGGCRETFSGDPFDARWRAIPATGDVPAARHCHTAVVDEGDDGRGSMVVFGGYGRVNRHTIYFCDLHVFDFPLSVSVNSGKADVGGSLGGGSGIWKSIKWRGAPPVARHSHSSVVFGREMWVFGGISEGAVALNDLAVLNLDTMAWRLEAPAANPPPGGAGLTAYAASQRAGGAGATDLPRNARASMTASGMHVGRPSSPVTSGVAATASLSDPPDTSPIMIRGERPEARWGHSAVVADFDGEPSMLVFGGYGSTFLGDMFQFAFRTQTWKRVRTFGTMIRGRQFHGAAVCGRSLFILGGFAVSQNLPDAFVFNLDTHNVSRIAVGKDVCDRRGHSMLVLPANCRDAQSSDVLVVCGGKRSENVDSFETYVGHLAATASPSLDSVLSDSSAGEGDEHAAAISLPWTELDGSNSLGEPPQLRHFHACVRHSNKLYVFGGFTNVNKNDVFELSLSLEQGQDNREALGRKDDVTASRAEGDDRGGGMSQLVGSTKFADIVLRTVDDCEVPGHRAVLFAFSERFGAAMEYYSETLDVNVSRPTLLAMLQWIYSGRKEAVLDSEDNLVELYRAADEYLLHDLRDECEIWLCRGVSDDNCGALLELAEQHGGERLVETCSQRLQMIANG